jgi:hypothetical protein
MSNTVNTTILQQYVDGELDPVQTQQVESDLDRDPQARQFVAFERQLRDRVGQVMADTPAAPADLRSRLSHLIQTTDLDEAADPVERQRPAEKSPRAVAGRIGPETTPEAHRPAARWQQINIFAVAATLMLVAGVVLVSIYAPTINEYGNDVPQRTVVSLDRISDFVQGEHGRCSGDGDYRQAKAHYHDQAEAREKLSAHLHATITIFDLSEILHGYTFVGGGECGVPGADRSAHLVYVGEAVTLADGSVVHPMASVFIEPLTDELPALTEGTWMESECGTQKLSYFTDGQLVYWITCCRPADQPAITAAVDAQLKAVGVAAP